MNSESEYKQYLIDLLNNRILGWIDGDTESNDLKTVDIVNHTLKIAIEIKDDKIYKALVVGPEQRFAEQVNNLEQKSSQFKKDARDANQKFRNYASYKTVLILRTEIVARPQTIEYIMGGLYRFVKIGGELVRTYNKDPHLSTSSTTEIGAYIFTDTNHYYFYENPNRNVDRIITLDELNTIIHLDIKNLY
jgi:hypothetical protein